ncbi:hypothetical protein EC973_007100 [Apophysomyces ossiformis]|uniref:Uncharacterized protein n=1 Tax=Apophysomyces ossiformis TaxID=679940 RepID=A0A8H7BYV5_9FUNG|nr:hypothetical protein EC973_007100 [Apophysomyces ossiformis]
MATVIHNNHQHSSKGCTSATCCSPSRLWRSIQTIISTNARDEFSHLCQDTIRVPHVVRVLLTSRLQNDASLYPASHKHRVIQFDPSVRSDACRKFGKPLTDLNALQLALVHNHEALACSLLHFLRQHTQNAELQLFLNHLWGCGNTSLHLACFFGMSRLVRLMVDLGADPSIRNSRQIGPVDCCTSRECLAALEKKQASFTNLQRPTSAPPTVITTNPPSLQRTSMLLKKAVSALPVPPPSPSPPTVSTLPIPDDYFKKSMMIENVPVMFPQDESTNANDVQHPCAQKIARPETILSPLSFSSSSSSSSFSSMSSIEEHTSKPSTPDMPDLCWSPPTSPMTPPPPPATPEDPYHPSRWTPSPTATTSIDMTKDEEMMAIEPSVPPTRPGCFPCNPPKQQHDRDVPELLIHQEKSEKASLLRQVRFDPHVVLVDACVHGDLAEVAQILHTTRMPVQQSVGDVHNHSLLQLALMHGHEHMVKYLVTEVGVDVNHPDNDGWTALHYAATLGLWSALEYLVSLAHANLNARTNRGLQISDCPKFEQDRRRCRLIIERAIRRSRAKMVGDNRKSSF